MKKKVYIITIVALLIAISYFLVFFVKLFCPSGGISEKKARQIALEVQSENQTESQTKRQTKRQTKSRTERQTKKETQNSINMYKMYKKILDGIFYDTGNTYVMNDPTFHFYYDLSCDSLISEKLTFVNPLDLELKNDSGFTVYVSRSTDGYVYSTEKPYFEEIVD